MTKFTGYFEIFGKKMRATTEANDKDEADQKIRAEFARKIVFSKIIEHDNLVEAT